MPTIAIRRSTGVVMPDFQSGATADGLRANAQRQGVPLDDLEIRTVSDAEYEAHVAPLRQEAGQREAERRADLAKAAVELQARLSLSDADVKVLRHLLIAG